MTKRFKQFACAVALLLLALQPGFSRAPSGQSGAPADDGTINALTAIAGQGMMDSHAFQYLTELSDDVGARLTGSPQAAQAIAWAAEKMKTIGLENVHTESWKMSRGWTRVSASAEMVAPLHHALLIDAMGWVGSTAAGGAEADVIAVNSYDLKNETQQNAAKWAGKVLLIVQKGKATGDGFERFAQFGPFLKTAYEAHAVAVIGGQGGAKSTGMHLTHTGALGFDTYYDIPVVSMGREDQEQLERLLDAGKTVRIKIDVQNRPTDGPVESANAVGEIRGTQNPEQIIVVGGHLDSWDLASGTTDNGMGTCTTLGAAEAIARSGFKPKRTIRFVLFTGEEEGLLGSIAYVKQHQNEMANHVAAVILDNGQGLVTGLQLGGRDDLVPAVQKFAEATGAFGKLEVNDDTEFGTDTGPFILAGLPGINLDQDSPDYKYTHHSAADTLDKVKPDILMRDATVQALTAFWIADRPERLASPWPSEKTAHMLIEKKQDTFLKLFNLWPFGDMGKGAAPVTKTN